MLKRVAVVSVAFAAIMGAAFSAQAAPILFTMTVPNASGENNGVFFVNQTVTIKLQADTAQVVNAGQPPGSTLADTRCVPAQSTSISVGGGAPLQAVAPVYFCSVPNAGLAGIFTSNVGWYFIANYSDAGITDFELASNFPLTMNVPGYTSPTTVPLNLAGGGIAFISTVPPTGTTFTALVGR